MRQTDRIGADVKHAFQVVLDILLLRAGPQDVPPTDSVFIAAVVASGAVSLLLALEAFSGMAALARAGLELGLGAVGLGVILLASGRSARFRQTFAAICATGALLGLLAWPLFGIVLERPSGDEFAALALLMLIGIYAWSVLVIGHILRHALDTGLVRGLAIGFVYVIAIATAAEWLMPATAAD